MKKLVGVVAIVVGVLLVMSGLDASDSVGSRLSRFFTGSPTDRTTWYLIGGVLTVLVGLSLTFYRRGQRA